MKLIFYKATDQVYGYYNWSTKTNLNIEVWLKNKKQLYRHTQGVHLLFIKILKSIGAGHVPWSCVLTLIAREPKTDRSSAAHVDGKDLLKSHAFSSQWNQTK